MAASNGYFGESATLVGVRWELQFSTNIISDNQWELREWCYSFWNSALLASTLTFSCLHQKILLWKCCGTELHQQHLQWPWHNFLLPESSGFSRSLLIHAKHSGFGCLVALDRRGIDLFHFTSYILSTNSSLRGSKYRGYWNYGKCFC